MENKFLHEMYLASLERTIRRLWILCIILVFLLVGSNAAWLYYESQFEDMTQTVTQESEGDNATNHFVGGDNYGQITPDGSN
jgi:hypothetical protein